VPPNYTTHVSTTTTSTVSPLSISSSSAPSTLLVLSDSIAAGRAPAYSFPATSTSLSSSDLLKYINSTSVPIKELPFAEKGSDGALSAAVPTTSGTSAGVVPASKGGAGSGSSKPGKLKEEDLTQKNPSNLESLGVTIKKDSDDFGGWYRQVLTYGDMLDYYDVSGCYILKPASYCIWESIQGGSCAHFLFLENAITTTKKKVEH